MSEIHDVPGPAQDYVGYGRNKPQAAWPNGAKAVVNIAVNYEEGSEAAWALGDGHSETLRDIAYDFDRRYRDFNTETKYEYGSRAGVWRILGLADDYHVKMTFFASAIALERNPEVGEWIRESGHEPCSHGWRWSEQWLMSRDEERTRIGMAIESIERTCGQRPRGWYSRYSPSVHTRDLLVEEGGFVYDSDAYNDDLPYLVDVAGREHVIVPYTGTYNDARFNRSYGTPLDFFEDVRLALDELWREGAAGFPKMMTVSLHPRTSGQPSRAAGLRQFIEYALSKGDVWFATRLEIAEWWRDHHADFARVSLGGAR